MSSFQAAVQKLESGKALLLDGGLATELEAAGYDIGSELWSAALIREHPEAVSAAHQAYVDAGADIITSASYQASQQGFMGIGLNSDQADDLIAHSVHLARQVSGACKQRSVLVAASVGPYGAILHDGSEYRGRYGLTEQQLYDFHAGRMRVLERSQPDLVACETIPDRTEAHALHRLLQTIKTPSWVSFQCRDEQHLADGSPLLEVARLFREHPNVIAIGVNCTAPQNVPALIKHCQQGAPDKAIIVYPNSGERFDVKHNCWRGTATPVEFSEAALQWQKLGAQLLGGCCRVSPEHISEMRAALDQAPAQQ